MAKAITLTMTVDEAKSVVDAVMIAVEAENEDPSWDTAESPAEKYEALAWYLRLTNVGSELNAKIREATGEVFDPASGWTTPNA